MFNSILEAGKVRSLPALLLALCICLSAARSQAIPANLNQYRRAGWTAEQGFSAGRVEALAQTPDGYLWIGTSEGLLRFDGFRFKPVLTDHQQPLRQILGLVVDIRGTLWVRTADTRIRQVHGDGISPPISVDGRLLGVVSMAAARGGGVNVTNMHKNAFRLDGNRMDPLPVQSRSLLLSIAEAADGRLWIGTDRGLFSTKPGSLQTEVAQDIHGKINCLLSDDNGGVWVGTDDGLAHWDRKRAVRVPGPDSAMQHLQVLTILKDREGNLWAGTSLGLLRYTLSDHVWVGTLQSADHSPVTALIQDREGDIWFGSGSALQRLKSTPIATVSLNAARSLDGFGPLYVDRHGRVWFAGLKHGLFWMDGQTAYPVTNDGMATDTVYSIDGDGDDVWVGRRNGGLTRLRLVQGKVASKTWTTQDGLSQNSIFAVRVAPGGDVWAGMLTGGLNLFSKGRFAHFDERNGLPANDVSALEVGSAGEVWVGTSNGVCRMEHGLCFPLLRNSLTGIRDVFALLDDPGNGLWIGTARGLFFAGRRGERQISLGNDLPVRIVGLGSGAGGKLWISSAHAVMSALSSDLMNSTSPSVQTYGTEDGLEALEGVHRARTVVSDDHGTVWFTTAHDLATAGFTPVPLPAVIPHVEEVSADGVTLDREHARVSAGARRLSFSFTGLDLHAPSRVRFRYRLDAFDKIWSVTTSNREATYTNLAPGKYRFRLVATNETNSWSSQESIAEVVIEPYLWQRWSVRSLAAVLVVFIVLLSYRARTNFLLSQANVLAEERLRERTRIARDVHDTLLQGFISSLMHLHVAEKQLESTSPLKQRFSSVLEGMERVIEDARLAVVGLRTPESGHGTLESSFHEFFGEIADIADAHLTLRSTGSPRRIRAQALEHISAIVKEAILNAMRHAEAKNVKITMTWGWFRFVVSVVDDGCGIEAYMLEHGRPQHWGLVGMRERAKQLKARLKIESRSGVGTAVHLSVPAASAYGRLRDAKAS